MPILLSKSISSQSSYAVWNIKETVKELEDLTEEVPPKGLDSKKSEWLVTRIMTNYLCQSHQLIYQGLGNDEYGKPFLKNLKAHVSITHSWPMAAVLLNMESACGIDLELPRQKLKMVRSRFLNPGDDELDLNRLCKIWAAKEVLYKIHGRKKLSLKDDIKTELISSDEILVYNLKSKDQAPIVVKIEPLNEYFLAYSV